MPYEQANKCTPEEIKTNRNRCWSPPCKNKAHFRDWCGWEWCFKHAIREIKQGETISSKWFRIIKMRIFK